MDNEFARAVEAHIFATTGSQSAQDALVDALFIALHDKVPGLTSAVIQHFEGMLPSASSALVPEQMAAFHRRADSIRHRLDLLASMPPAG